jgi:hypothetical protein
MTQSSNGLQPSLPQTPAQPEAEKIAARLLYLLQQEKAVKEEISRIRQRCENLYGIGSLAAKTDLLALFSDGSTQRIRLGRSPGGTYFKVVEAAKEAWAEAKKTLEQSFLADGRAEMAEKASSWTAKVVKK